MTISTNFQDTLNLVDASKVLTFVVDPAFVELEWEYDGLTVTGGSEAACAIGAAALLHAMGFRFYTPQPAFWKLPAIIATNLQRARAKSWISALNIFLVYGQSWA
jgi:hypothetical protein